MLDIEKDTTKDEAIEKEAEIEIVDEKKDTDKVEENNSVQEIKLDIVEATPVSTDVTTVEDKVETVVAVDAENDKSKKKNKKKGKKGDDTQVVEVTNIPNEVVSNKESKKSKKFSSFMSFTFIVLALVFSIVDWAMIKFTSNPTMNLHLMDVLIILLYLTIAVKAFPFLNGKKKWIKIVYWVCVIATLVFIMWPMIGDYIEIAKHFESNQTPEQTEQVKNIISLFM